MGELQLRAAGNHPSVTPVLTARRAERGFERLYQRHAADIYRYVLAVVDNQADAEDATQQTFLSAYRAWERGERPRSPHNWLIAIAHNVCRQRFRESARRPSEVMLDEEALPSLEEEEAPRAQDIRRALAHIALNQRAALVMRELEGRSYREIAEVLGVSHGAVETLLFRARRALREQLEGDLTCGEAERALSRQADDLLTRAERANLRAHLRECRECAALERSCRARRTALRGIGTIPLPPSLATFGGGAATATGSAVGIGLAAKAAATVAVGALAVTTGEAIVAGERERASSAGADAASAAGQLAKRSGAAAGQDDASGATPAPTPRPARGEIAKRPKRAPAEPDGAEAAAPAQAGAAAAAAAGGVESGVAAVPGERTPGELLPQPTTVDAPVAPRIAPPDPPAVPLPSAPSPVPPSPPAPPVEVPPPPPVEDPVGSLPAPSVPSLPTPPVERPPAPPAPPPVKVPATPVPVEVPVRSLPVPSVPSAPAPRVDLPVPSVPSAPDRRVDLPPPPVELPGPSLPAEDPVAVVRTASPPGVPSAPSGASVAAPAVSLPPVPIIPPLEPGP